ncbi:MAG: hypothetical protein HQ580_00945 [Planctomycetes bacterium]|nr:hypothetical protein [Planctomycetota bacterium]
MPTNSLIGLPTGSVENMAQQLGIEAGLFPEPLKHNADIVVSSKLPGVSFTLEERMDSPRYLTNGELDGVIVGTDYLVNYFREQLDELHVVCLLPFGKRTVGREMQHVLAVPQESEVTTLQDLFPDEMVPIIATECPVLLDIYLNKNQHRNGAYRILHSHGQTERCVRSKKEHIPPLADAMVDVSETGTSLRARRLRGIGTVAKVAAALIPTREIAESQPDVLRRIQDVGIHYHTAITHRARGMTLLSFNVPHLHLETAQEIIRPHQTYPDTENVFGTYQSEHEPADPNRIMSVHVEVPDDSVPQLKIDLGRECQADGTLEDKPKMVMGQDSFKAVLERQGVDEHMNQWV